MSGVREDEIETVAREAWIYAELREQQLIAREALGKGKAPTE